MTTPSSRNPNGGPDPHDGADPQERADPQETAWFRDLFATTYTPLVAYARRRTGDVSEADDIVAEVFTTVWRRRHDGDPNQPTPSPPLPWLYGIAANVIRNHRRSTARRLRLVDRLESQPGRHQHDPADLAAETLRDALDDLPFDDQELLRLIAWEGLSHSEIAAALGISTNAVGVRAHRARKRLQAELDARDAAPQHPERPRTDTRQPSKKEGTT